MARISLGLLVQVLAVWVIFSLVSVDTALPAVPALPAAQGPGGGLLSPLSGLLGGLPVLGGPPPSPSNPAPAPPEKRRRRRRRNPALSVADLFSLYPPGWMGRQEFRTSSFTVPWNPWALINPNSAYAKLVFVLNLNLKLQKVTQK